MQIYSIKPSSKPNADFKVSNYMHSTPLQNLKTTLSPLVSYIKNAFILALLQSTTCQLPQMARNLKDYLSFLKVNEKMFSTEIFKEGSQFCQKLLSLQIF